MTFNIKTAQVSSPEAVRRLVLESLGPHVGVEKIIDPELPLNGSPILALDTEGYPLVISLDPDDGAEALLKGLTAWDECQSGKPWLARLYPMLSIASISKHLRLMVLSPDLPPGALCLGEHQPLISFGTFRFLRLDTDTAVLIELQAIARPGDQSREGPSTGPMNNLAEECKALGLDEEETTFFENIR